MTIQGNVPIRTRISPDILDTIGRTFKFKHAKGIAEWLKNSLDNYLRLHEGGKETRNGNWPVLLCLIDSQSSKRGPNLAVIDFGGTTYQSVEDFFLFWGSRTAASHGELSNAAVTGGHGNGGKFYMREMWRGGARFSTWHNDKATSLVVEKRSDGTTGYWEIQNESMGWRESLSLALNDAEGLGGGESIISHLNSEEPEIIAELDAGAHGFTVVVGRRAQQVHSSNDVVIGGRWNHQKLIDELRDASQARRPIRELDITVLRNGQLGVDRLMPAKVDEDPEWPLLELDVPVELLRDIAWRTGHASAGTLRIAKSAIQLSGRHKDLNSIFILDRQGNPIANYPFAELPFPGYSPVLSLFNAELRLTFSQVEELVQNDRERLVNTPTTEAILAWVVDRIWERVGALEEQQRSQEQNSELQKAAVLNDALNQHAKRFLEELQTEMMVDYIEDPKGGGFGDTGDGIGGVGKGSGGDNERDSGKGGGEGVGGTAEVPGTQSSRRRPRFPQVLLSGIDEDPASPGSSKHFTDRHPPLEQDDIDKLHNVWWINTTHPFAAEAIRREGARGHAFKSHQLYMFRDVVQREALRFLQRRETELGLDRVENELSEASNRFLADLPIDLVQEFLG